MLTWATVFLLKNKNITIMRHKPNFHKSIHSVLDNQTAGFNAGPVFLQPYYYVGRKNV